MAGHCTIMSSSDFSLASFEAISGSGLLPTFQMACWMGMGVFCDLLGDYLCFTKYWTGWK